MPPKVRRQAKVSVPLFNQYAPVLWSNMLPLQRKKKEVSMPKPTIRQPKRSPVKENGAARLKKEAGSSGWLAVAFSSSRNRSWRQRVLF